MKKLGNADVVVIGGGAVGTAVACYLALDGKDVALIERGEFAWGSSRRCDGHAVTYDSPPGYFSQFCKLGLDMFPQIIPQLDCDIEFEPEGIGLLVDNEKDMETVLETYEGKKAEGVSVSLWDRKELHQNEPHVADHVVGCLNFEGDAKLNPMRLCFGLARLAEKNKARIYTRTQVYDIIRTDGVVSGVQTDKGLITTPQVVIAAGVWTPEIAHKVGVAVPIRPRQGHVLVTERVQGLIGKNYAEYGYLAAKGGTARPGVTPAMEQFGVAMVLEPSHAGTILMGSSRRYVGMDTNPSPDVMKAQAQRTLHFFPASKDVAITKAHDTFTVNFTNFGKKKSLSGKSVLLHEGVVSETRITRLARLRHTWDAEQRYWYVEPNTWGATNLDGISCAGDTARVRGADAAMAFGRVAALDICQKLQRLVLSERDTLAKPYLNILRRCNAMQPFLDKVFSPHVGMLQPADDAIVCRCEEITAKELRTTIEQGCYSPDGLKAQARPGMGTCQGRMCTAAVAEMIAQTNAIPLEQLDPYHAQPPLFPLSIEELAFMDMPNSGL